MERTLASFLPTAFELKEELKRGGDLLRLIGLKRLRKERILRVNILPERAVTNSNGQLLPQQNLDGDEPQLCRNGKLVTFREPGEIARGVVFIDSLGEIMIPQLARHFKRCVFIHNSKSDRKLIASEKPNIVILELVERRLISEVSKLWF